jgi:hypothetical protein
MDKIETLLNLQEAAERRNSTKACIGLINVNNVEYNVRMESETSGCSKIKTDLVELFLAAIAMKGLEKLPMREVHGYEVRSGGIP